jgi:iron complex outermembrane receptor protein
MPAEGENMITRFALACAFSVLPAIGWAQAPDEESSTPIVIADFIDPQAVIVVRGDRRSRLSAPIAASVFSAEALADRAINTLDTLVMAAPGLHMINDQDPGTNIVSLRGVTTDRLQQAAIAYVIDDVPLADTELFTAPLFDLERADVLRGPQGALFGKNAAGGAIEVRTLDGDVDDGYLQLSAGDGAFRSAEAAHGFLRGDWGVRIAGQWNAADGWIKNRTLNRVVDAQDSRAARLSVAGHLGAIDLDARLFALHEDGGAAWASSNNVTGLYGGALKGDALSDPIGDFEGRAKRDWMQTSLRARWDAGYGEFFALIARDDYRKRWVEELDYRPGAVTFFGAPLFLNGLQPIRQPTDIGATTFDARYRWHEGGGDSESVYVFGVFAQDIDRDRTDDFGPLLFGAPAPFYETDSLQTALYGSARWRWSRFTLDVQGRFDRDRRTQAISNTATGARLETRRATFERFQPRLGASYQVSDGAFIYANLAEGFRTGGFNPAPTPTSVWRAQFAPEVTRSAEIGLKMRGALSPGAEYSIETAAYASQIDQYQSYTFLDGNSVTLSVDSVDVRGFEASGALNFDASPLDAIAVSAAFALADSEIAAFIAPDPLIAGSTRDYRGKQVPNAPLWSANVSGQWTHQRAETQTLRLRADVNATGETFYEIDNALRSPPKAWLDLTLAWSRAARSFDGPRAGDWHVALIGKNVTDERWAISAFGQGMLPLLAGLGPNGPFDTFTLNRGRQVRLELRRDF